MIMFVYVFLNVFVVYSFPLIPLLSIEGWQPKAQKF